MHTTPRTNPCHKMQDPTEMFLFFCRRDALYYSPAKDYTHNYKKISLMHSKIGTAEQYTPRKNAFGVMDPIDRVIHIMAADRLEGNLRTVCVCVCVCVCVLFLSRSLARSLYPCFSYVCVCVCVCVSQFLSEMLTSSLHL
jgi:hypothetical protein